MDTDKAPASYQGSPRNVKHINAIQWDRSLEPEHYELSGTEADSRLLFLDVNIIDSTGAEPFRGDVLIEGQQLRRRLGCKHFAKYCSLTCHQSISLLYSYFFRQTESC